MDFLKCWQSRSRTVLQAQVFYLCRTPSEPARAKPVCAWPAKPPQERSEERRIASEMMFHYRSNVPTKENGQELKKPAEDFRKFKEGSAEVEVLVDLFFFPGFPYRH
jgi:hypothetical protein